MADVVTALQDLITLAGTDPDTAADRFDVLVDQHGRVALAEVLTAVTPNVVAETLGYTPLQ